MRKNRLTITGLATCVVFSLMAGCWQSKPAAGEYEYALLFDRDRMKVYGVDLGDIRGALSEHEIVRVDPENSEGILLEIAIEEDKAADPAALMDRILVEPYGRPVRLRDIGILRVTKAASAR
jgi:multidrug efflux pump subunit AcrB